MSDWRIDFDGSALEMSFTTQFVLVFLGAALVDWLWSGYILATASRQALKAALFGASIFSFGALVTISYIHDIRLLIAAALGGGVGTYTCIKFTGNKTSKEGT